MKNSSGSCIYSFNVFSKDFEFRKFWMDLSRFMGSSLLRFFPSVDKFTTAYSAALP